MKESGQSVTIDNTAGVVTLTPGLPAAAPAAHSDSVHSGAVANLLTALTPTFANWTQNPGTNADLVDELKDTALTTNGIGAAGNNTIVYNLGSSKRRFVHVRCDKVVSVSISDDNNAYHILSETNAVTIFTAFGAGKFQYLKTTVVGIQTVGDLRHRCYNIN